MSYLVSLMWALVGGAWVGQSLSPAGTMPAVTPPAVRPESASPQVLILMDEATVVGRFERQADGSVRRLDGGGQVYSKRQVARLCASLEEAYLCLRGRANLRDPHERYRLAQWCLRHGLPNFARVEAEAALELMPEFPAARQMLAQAVQAERAMKEKQALPATGAAAFPRPTAEGSAHNAGSREGGAAPKEAKASATAVTPSSLAELDQQANTPLAAVSFAGWEQMLQPMELQEFTRSIQPILINGCGSGACHGDPARREAGFYLLRGYEGRLSSQQTRANLAQVLKLIDKERPSQSPLLRRSILPHGGSERLPFGSADAVAVQVLSAWVRRIAPEPQAAVVDPNVVPAGGVGSMMTTEKPAGRTGEPAFAVDGPAGVGPAAVVAPPLRPEPRAAESGTVPGAASRSAADKGRAEPPATGNSNGGNNSAPPAGSAGPALPPPMSLGGKVVSGPLRPLTGGPAVPGAGSTAAPAPLESSPARLPAGSPPAGAASDPFDPADFNRQHHPGRGL